MGIIHYMRVVNTDTLSHHHKFPEKCLQTSDKEKKWKYLKACLWQRRQLSPYVVSVDCLIGMEAKATLKRIAIRLAKKCKQPYSRTCGYLNSRAAITLVRATYLCIRGSCVSEINISVQRPQWGDGAGIIHFFQ